MKQYMDLSGSRPIVTEHTRSLNLTLTLPTGNHGPLIGRNLFPLGATGARCLITRHRIGHLLLCSPLFHLWFQFTLLFSLRVEEEENAALLTNPVSVGPTRDLLQH